MTPKGKGRRAALLLGGVVLLAVSITAYRLRDSVPPSYRFWRLFERMGTNSRGQVEYRHRKTGVILVSLSAGTVDWADSGYAVDAFLISKSPLSRAEIGQLCEAASTELRGKPVRDLSRTVLERFSEETEFSIPTIADFCQAIAQEAVDPGKHCVWARHGSSHVYYTSHSDPNAASEVTHLYVAYYPPGHKGSRSLGVSRR